MILRCLGSSAGVISKRGMPAGCIYNEECTECVEGCCGFHPIFLPIGVTIDMLTRSTGCHCCTCGAAPFVSVKVSFI